VSLFAIAIAALTARLAWIGPGGKGVPSRLDVKARFLLLVGATFLLTASMIATLHLALNLKYPSERTGLYLVPLAILCGTSVLDRLLAGRGPRRILGIAAFAGCLLVVGQFIIQFHVTYYRTWQYDAASRQVFQMIERQHERDPDKKVRIACSWVLEPSLNFYRISRGTHRMEPVLRTVDSREYDYYVDLPIAPLPPHRTSPIFHDEVSGATVGVPNAGTAANRGQNRP
jgi:hypothetical protein